MHYCWVFVGGGLGSLLRYALSQLNGKYIPQLPIGTLLANVLATALLAWVMYSQHHQAATWQPTLRLLLATGFCGGFSTFSTFGYETHQLLQQGYWAWATANVVLHLSMCAVVLVVVQKSAF